MPNATRIDSLAEHADASRDGADTSQQAGAERFSSRTLMRSASGALEIDLRRKIEEQARALRRAEAARQKAQRTAEARAAFVAATSHEIRTPLNAIIGFSEILKTEMFGPLPNDRYREYAKIIHDSGSRLLDLINDILDMSKLDAGKIEMHFEPVEVLRMIVDCVRGVEPLAARAAVGIRVSLYDGLDWIVADPKRLRQMLLNLLSNAIKFTHQGGEICVAASRGKEGIAISVSDTGIGIEPDEIARVLEPFGQVDSELGRMHEGTGLGIPLTRELARLHGGALQIESAVGIGTTMTIELPWRPVSPKTRGAAKNPADKRYFMPFGSVEHSTH